MKIYDIMKYLFCIFSLLFLLNGCVVFKLTTETVKTVGTVAKATGKVVEVTGTGVVTTLQTVGKCVEAGGKVAEAVVKTPGVKEVIASKVKP